VNIKLLLHLLLPLTCFSQNQINIKVIDDSFKPISSAIVVINQNEKQLGFGTTDIDGSFTTNFEDGNYEIKVSKLGYVALIKNIVLEENINLEVLLESDINKLETVIIKSRPKIMKIKGDTISYNIKAVTDGTENKVEDLIKKLPGLNVDEAGKVSYKGQQIDKVLIDGNEFFNNKHQMATQNINANMVEGIDLLLNHTGFSGASRGDKSIALNLKIKDGFKNKWIGEIDFGAGTTNAFKMHNNLFKFLKNGNIAIIADYNTLAKTPISYEDYNEMQSISEISVEEQNLTQIEMPSFLNPNSFFTEKKNSFVGIHYTSKFSEKSKITATNIFNKANSVEAQFKNQINIGEENTTRFFSDLRTADYILNNTYINWEYNKSKKTYFSYFAGFTPNFDKNYNSIINENTTLESDNYNNSTNFSQQLYSKTKLFQQINHKFYLKHKYQITNQKLNLHSLNPFFNSNLNQINQESKIKNNLLSLVNEFSLLHKTNLFSIKFNLLTSSSTFDSSISQNQNFTNNLDYSRKMIEIYPSWLKNWTKKFQSTIGAKINASKIEFISNDDNYVRFEPNINITYNLALLNKISFNYSLSHELPNISQLQQNNLITDFQTIYKSSLVSYNQVLPRNEFSLDYLNINTNTQSVFFSKISYSTTSNAIATNNSYQNNFIQNNFINTLNSTLLNALAHYDLKFSKVPFLLKNTFAYFDTQGITQFENINNNTETAIISGKSQITSNFKKSNIQFDLTFNLRQTTFNQTINSFSNKSINKQTSLNVRGKIKTDLIWNVEIKRDLQNSEISRNEVYFLNANLSYNISKSIKFNINGFNLLNLDNSEVIATNINESFFTETVTQILPGYVVGGFSFSY